jgi:hypothetical protein
MTLCLLDLQNRLRSMVANTPTSDSDDGLMSHEPKFDRQLQVLIKVLLHTGTVVLPKAQS